MSCLSLGERVAAGFLILHLISAGFHSGKPHGKRRAADYSILKQISAGLTLRIWSNPVDPAGSDTLLLYFCDGSLAGGNPWSIAHPNILYRAPLIGLLITRTTPVGCRLIIG